MTISSIRRRYQSLPLWEESFGAALPWEPWETPLPSRKRRPRRPYKRLLARAKQDHFEVSIAADDSISFRPLPPAPSSPDEKGNELDAWIARHHAH